MGHIVLWEHDAHVGRGERRQHDKSPGNQVRDRRGRIGPTGAEPWPAEQTALLSEVLDRVAAGDLHPPAPTERPLAEAGAVLRDLLERRLRGKTVLIP